MSRRTKRALIADYRQQVRQGTYWGIMTEITGYQVADALLVPREATHYLASIRTRLNPFPDDEQCRLIHGGYALCDAAMRRYVIPGQPVQPPQWPYPAHALNKPIPPPATVDRGR